MTHSFQDMSLDYFEENPFNKIQDGFLVVTERNGQVNAMTAAWGGLGIMWGKKVAYIVIRDSRYTKEILDDIYRFSLTFLDPAAKETKMMLKYFGTVSGRKEDKIKGSRMTVDHYQGVPYLDEGKLVLICKKLYRAPMPAKDFIDSSIDKDWYSGANQNDYHNLYIAEIETMLAR